MSLGPVKCLLVDDVEENLLALEALLRRDGLDVMKASSGVEALEILLVHEVALAIVDVQMPQMDGFELAELMRGMARTRHIPLIFLTAGGIDDKRRFRGYEAGAVDFLFKPIEPHILQSKAEVFFELHRQRQEVILQREELRAAALENANLLAESRRIMADLEKSESALRESEVALRTLNEQLEQRIAERTQELENRNRELQQFAFVASHDFQEPLRKIQTFASLLVKEVESRPEDTILAYAERLQAAASRMSQLLQEMLSFEHVTSEGQPFTRVELADVVRQVLSDVKSNIEEVDARINIRARGTLMADEAQIRKVLSHLVLNALKFRHPQRRPEIHILAAIEQERNGDARGQECCRIEVRDNGIGFDPAYEERIFRPFERLHATEEYSGTGMGLTIVRRIVDRHGGTIHAEGRPEEGATFSVKIPTQSTAPRLVDHHARA